MAEDERTSRDANAAARPEKENRYAVLDVFGLKLEVSNPRLAELLTMDAKEALGSDLKDLVGGQESSPPESAATAAVAQEAVPEVTLAAPTPREETDARLRREFRARAEANGAALGFVTSEDGIWQSQSGLAIVVRAIERSVSLAAASHYVGEIAGRRESIAGEDSTALFIVDNQQTADVFKVAIRQRKMYDLMRTISMDNLEDVRDLVTQGAIDHAQAVVLLVPITNIDVGEVLSIIRATHLDESA